jgi:hypothetical protein
MLCQLKDFYEIWYCDLSWEVNISFAAQNGSPLTLREIEIQLYFDLFCKGNDNYLNLVSERRW